MRVLLIEADPVVAGRLTEELRGEFIEVRSIPVAPEGRIDVDLVLIGLPDGDRHAICRALRADHARQRIVMLAPEPTEAQSVAALVAGADHVIPRHGMSAREIAARLRAVGRRRGGAPLPRPSAVVEAGLLRVDPETRRVEVGGALVGVVGRELDVLVALARRPGHTVDRESLGREVWGERSVDSRALDSVVKRLRLRLGESAERIETVRGVGYRLRV